MTPKKINPKKTDEIASLASSMKSAKSVVFVDYSGMGVKASQDLKSRLKETGGTMTVSKNTLLKLAGKEAGLPDETLTDSILVGQTAIVFASDDAVAPIQTIGKFAKEFELPKMKAGVVEGSFQGSEGLARISTLPGKQELYGQVVGSVMSPMYGLVAALQGNLQKLVFILDQKRQQG